MNIKCEKQTVDILIWIDSEEVLQNIGYHLRNVLSKIISKYKRNCLYVVFNTNEDLELILPIISELNNNINYMIDYRKIKINKNHIVQRMKHQLDSIFNIADYCIYYLLDIYGYDKYNENDTIRMYNLFYCYDMSNLLNQWSCKLSDEQKLIYDLKKYDKLTDEEISENTGLSIAYICRKKVEVLCEISKCHEEYVKQVKKEGMR